MAETFLVALGQVWSIEVYEGMCVLCVCVCVCACVYKLYISYDVLRR